jgi:hypothetical protein
MNMDKMYHENFPVQCAYVVKPDDAKNDEFKEFKTHQTVLSKRQIWTIGFPC